jgi:hypothetical protein
MSSLCGQPTSLRVVNYCFAGITYLKSKGPQLVYSDTHHIVSLHLH